MLRLIVLLLLLANAAYFAWSQGVLAAWGLAPAQQSEPQRLAQQIKPQAVRILGSDEAKLLDAAAGMQGAKLQECLQAGVFEDGQVAGLKQLLARWPANSWLFEPAAGPGELRGQMLKLPAVDDSLRPRVEELRAALNGKNLRPCR
jgi:hypothetical protein